MNIYVSALPSRKELDIPVEPSHQAHPIVIEGGVECNDICSQLRDAVEIDESFCTKTLRGAHVIPFGMVRKVYFQERHELHKVEEIRLQGCRYRSIV